MNTRLSIVLPLKGREQFTERCIKAARLAGHVIVADGSQTPQELWTDRAYVDYFYAGHDVTLSRFWRKMLLALDRVETPYVTVADNDDIVVPGGLARCCDYLDDHADYASVSGRIQGFWCWPDPVTGPHHARTRQYAPYDIPADYNQPTINARVLAGFANSWAFYAVYRTEALMEIRQAVCDLELTDLQIHEKFCAMKALALGKAACLPGFTSLLRQYGTGATSAVSQGDFIERLMRNASLSGDIGKVLRHISDLGVDYQSLLVAWEDWWRSFISRNYGPWPQLRKAVKAKMPWLADKVQNRHKLSPRRFVAGLQP